MYPEILDHAIDEDEARKQAGNNAVNTVLAENCEFSNRVIDDVFGVYEMTAHADFTDADGDERVLTVRYLVDKDQVDSGVELENLDYSKYTFTID